VEPLRHALVKAEDPSSNKAVQAFRGRGEGRAEFLRPNSPNGETRVYKSLFE